MMPAFLKSFTSLAMQQLSRRIPMIIAASVLLRCSSDKVLVYAPPEFAGGQIVVDGSTVASFGSSQRGYRWVGWKGFRREFGLPPRSETRGEFDIPAGAHTIEIRQVGYEPLTRKFERVGHALQTVDMASEPVTPTLILGRSPDETHCPASCAADLKLANELFREGKFANAAEEYERVFSVSRDPNVAINRGVCLWKIGQSDRAMAVFRDITKHDPTFWEALYNEAVLLIQNGELESARPIVNRVGKLQPGNAAYVRLEAALLSRSGE
jgi:tetratricopeptide (TPR) repeat protein